RNESVFNQKDKPMKPDQLRYLSATIFIAVSVMAISQQHDFVEASIWFCFAAAVLLPALTEKATGKVWRSYLPLGFIILGIVLLVLRLLDVFPVPVRPLP